ncbi:transmembrane reductase CYB561D2-like isoform X1 [Phymastichus coffea]|uniref:transmembrane reductase CYB561D2-like isoform X1 n=1 Tax=Phymastichus coffea TaxID=108790 RepID=UPI00273B4183|nr:transmembrane reductase CYB561D2-like isoform X1 [Phymastichus coffea]XP_058798608.1 transmembrane reductase CYB561D2-like isoform X1 [Phymastichus coffea]
MKSEEQQQQHGDRGLSSTVAFVFSMLTHILLLVSVLYIVGLGFQNYQLFSWHPICMALSAGFLLIEGVYAISGEAFVSKKLTRKNRITLHWILHLVGLILMTIGLVITIVNKNKLGKDHFVTTHAQLGLAVFVIVWVIAAFGILANNAQWFYPTVRPVLLKVVHSCAGICMVILLLATVINGTYTKWWGKSGGTETSKGLVFAALFIAGVLVIVKPIIGAIARTRVLMRPPPSAQSSSNVAAS